MNGLALAWRLARRELRAGVRGFRVFIASLALGVGAIVAVGSLSHSVVAGLNADGRKILGGDIELRLHDRPPSPEQARYLEDRATALGQTVEMRAMAKPAADGGRRALVELKAVDERYPLVGALALKPAMTAADALARAPGGAFGAVADANLLERLGLRPGDRLQVGEATFVVRATIESEPDRVATVFSLGPRLMVSAAALPATGLVQPGSRIHYQTRVALAAGADVQRFVADLKQAFPKAGWRILEVDEAAPGIRRFIDRLTLFLSFVGLTVLLVGGIGVGNAVKAYLDGKTATIATFKCLGAASGLILRTYLAQVTVLALAGIAIGAFVGALAPMAGLVAFGHLLPVKPVIAFFAPPIVTGALFGFLTALTFAVWPLARARAVPAASLFRERVSPLPARRDARALAAVAVGTALLGLLTVATASDRAFAWWFVGGAVATLVLLRSGAHLVMAAAARARRLPGAEARLAVANLHRPGASTPGVVLSLGVGLAVLVAIAMIEGNLGRMIGERLPEEAPAFFFIDIQPDQVAGFDAAVTGVAGTHRLQRVPTLRGRIVAIDGVDVEKAAIDPGSEWAVRGDRALTYAAARPEAARLVAGRWWPADYAGPPLISLDAGLARGFGVGVGDTLTLNVLGREITAEIASTREIDWRSLRFDFAIIFAPGALEGAPQTHIAAVEAPRSVEDAVEKAVVERFANVSVVRVREALAAAARILDGIGAAVRAVAAIAIVAGAIVLAGAIAAGRERRIYDAVVFKVLGATRASMLGAFLIEYGILGLSTGLIALVIGTATAWAVVVFLLDAQWVFLPGPALWTLAACLILTLLAGFAGTWRALGSKAAPYLRNE